MVRKHWPMESKLSAIRPTSVPQILPLDKLGRLSIITARVRLSDYRRSTDGKSQIYLDCHLRNKRKRFLIGVWVHPDSWSITTERVKGRSADARDANLIIQQELARLNEIVLKYRFANKPLDLNTLAAEFRQPVKTDLFIDFCRAHLKARKHMLQPGTYRHHRCTLDKWADWNAKLTLPEITHEVLSAFREHLIKSGLKYNTVVGQIRRINIYINEAIRTGLITSNPLNKFKTGSYVPGDRDALNASEVQRLIRLQQSEWLNPNQQLSLRQFLFSCYSGLRISDILNLQADQLVDNVLIIIPKKTKRFNKIIRVPLPDAAIDLVYSKNPGSPLFPRLSQQKINDHLKEIARVANIRKRLTFHVARHTFASNFLEAGGHVEVLQQLLGHSNLRETMIYVHINQEQKRRQIQALSNLYAP